MKAEQIKQLLSENKTIKEIAEIVNVTTDYVYKVKRTLSISVVEIPDDGTKRSKIRQMLASDKSIIEIAEEVGVTTDYVYKIKRLPDTQEQIVQAQNTIQVRPIVDIDTTLNLSDWKIPTIGSDPEFLFKHGIRKVPAYELLPNRGNSQAGCDGCSSTGELRPKYEDNADKHTTNVRKCLVKVKKAMLKRNASYKLVAGGGYDSTPIGGHIHIGINEILHSHEDRISFKVKLSRIYDLISVATYNLFDTNATRSRKHSYGHLNDMRGQAWGYEYRTQPSWLVNPRITRGLLALHHAFAIEIINNKEFETIATRNRVLTLSQQARGNFRRQTLTERQRKLYKNKLVKLLSQMKVIKANMFNYNNIISDFLKLIDETKSDKNKIQYIDEQAWGLNSIKYIPNFTLFKINKDDYLENIPATVNKRKAKKAFTIIGLKSERELDVSISTIFPKAERKIIIDFCDENNLTLGLVDRQRLDNVIGFGYDLRKDKMNKIQELLNKLKEVN